MRSETSHSTEGNRASKHGEIADAPRHLKVTRDQLKQDMPPKEGAKSRALERLLEVLIAEIRGLRGDVRRIREPVEVP